MKIRLTLIFLLSVLIAQAQVQRVYSKGEGSSILTVENGYYICGTVETNTNNRCGLIKIDLNGNVVWQKTYKDQIEFYSSNSDIIRNQDGTLVICGVTFNDTISNEEISLIKVDSLGNKLWSKRIGNQLQDDEIYKILKDTDGGYLLAGTSFNFNFRQNDFYLIKTDSTGNIIWEKTYGSQRDENCNFFLKHGSQYILAGNSKDSTTNEYNMTLMTLDSSGGVLSSVVFPIPGYESIQSIATTSQNEMIIVAKSKGPATLMNDNSLILKIDSVGNTLWLKYLSGVNNFPSSVIVDPSNNIIVSGAIRNTITDINAFVIKLDPLGNIISQLSFGNSYGGKINQVKIDVNDQIIFTGNYVRTDNLNSYVTFGKFNFNDSLCSTTSITLNSMSDAVNGDSISFQTFTDTVEQISSVVIVSATSFSDSSLCNLSDEIQNKELEPIKIFPNPATDRVEISLPKNFNSTIVKIFDFSGKLVTVLHKENDTFTIQLNGLADGIYLISIDNGKHHLQTKLLVQRK